MSSLSEIDSRIKKGGAEKYHEKAAQSGKLFVRKRIELLVDKGSFVEDGQYANCDAEGLPADGIVTGLARIGGKPVALMGNDSTVKAGSWGWRTVEKIVRIQETAESLMIPLFYLVDSAGARITDQVEMFPGRRGAGRIFYNQSNLSGKVPQICLLFGPSAAGGAYIPAFCDVVIMVRGNASMYLGSPRMAEMVIGEKVSLEEMGGADMHCSVSGCGDFVVDKEEDAIELAKRYFSYFPINRGQHPEVASSAVAEVDCAKLSEIIPASAQRAYDMKKVIATLVDKGSFLEVKEKFAPELITGLGRMEGRVVGIIANQPKAKGGVLFVDSSDKAARFMQLCDAYSIPLLYLADVPGFMIGSKIEKEGMIRAGAKMIYAMSRVSVPKISVIVRKAYGAGLYGMSGPAFHPDCTLALPTAKIAVMGPEPAVNAVYFNKMKDLSPEDKKVFMKEKIQEYEKDVDIYRLAGQLIIDQMVDFKDLRLELTNRLSYYQYRVRPHSVAPGVMPM